MFPAVCGENFATILYVFFFYVFNLSRNSEPHITVVAFQMLCGLHCVPSHWNQVSTEKYIEYMRWAMPPSSIHQHIPAWKFQLLSFCCCYNESKFLSSSSSNHCLWSCAQESLCCPPMWANKFPHLSFHGPLDLIFFIFIIFNLNMLHV